MKKILIVMVVLLAMTACTTSRTIIDRGEQAVIGQCSYANRYGCKYKYEAWTTTTPAASRTVYSNELYHLGDRVLLDGWHVVRVVVSPKE